MFYFSWSANLDSALIADSWSKNPKAVIICPASVATTFAMCAGKIDQATMTINAKTEKENAVCDILYWSYIYMMMKQA